MDIKVTQRFFNHVTVSDNCVVRTVEIVRQTPNRTIGICRRKQYVCVEENSHHLPGHIPVPFIQIALCRGKLCKAVLRVDLYRKGDSRPEQDSLVR